LPEKSADRPSFYALRVGLLMSTIGWMSGTVSYSRFYALRVGLLMSTHQLVGVVAPLDLDRFYALRVGLLMTTLPRKRRL
jgi:hypothetical protein